MKTQTLLFALACAVATSGAAAAHNSSHTIVDLAVAAPDVGIRGVDSVETCCADAARRAEPDSGILGSQRCLHKLEFAVFRRYAGRPLPRAVHYRWGPAIKIVQLRFFMVPCTLVI